MKRINTTPQEMVAFYQNLAQSQGHGDETFAKFQKNIVKAVEDILDDVNHPSELDIDFAVDVTVKGMILFSWVIGRRMDVRNRGMILLIKVNGYDITIKYMLLCTKVKE